MDSKTSTRHNTDLLERMLLDENAEPTHLPLSILEGITSGFSDDQEIGRGGFAVVYKGIVGKQMVAVKKLSRTFDLPEHKFHREVECLMKVKHKNIVRFLGYCSETHGRTADNEGKFIMADIRNWLLCFEYVPNGSLDKYITDASRGHGWRGRYEIIKGICKGLLHLHKKRILHSDLKPGNILVDDQMVPKIVDFGLSRCLDKEQTRAFTSNLCGSLGYLAPEFFSGQVTFASDIYSLGVIIVEILTGEKGYPEDKDVVDAWMNRLEGSDQWEIQLEQVRVCIKIGKECMDSDTKKRPIARRINCRLDKMASVVKTSINSSSAEEHVSFLEGQYGQEKVAKFSSKHLRKDFKEWAKIEERGEFVGTPREDHWWLGREEAPGDPCSLLGAQDTKQNLIRDGANICTFLSGLLYKLSNLDIFNIKALMNYMRYGGPTLNCRKSLKLFKRWEVKPFLEDRNLIGKDGFGDVYLGIHDGVPFVVRKLISSIGLENEGFACDVVYQSQLVHKNIVRLIGCCVEFDVPMLVLEFLSKGSLNEILHGNKRVPISLDVRLSIAAGLTVSIDCLHSHGGMKTLVKPANILLDDDFVPKLSNFGTSKFIARDCKGNRTLVDDMYYLDDLAYVDPLYLERGLLTDKSDVYSFGVVLLELLTREKATHDDSNNLVSNFLENHKQGRKSTELFDKEITVAGDLELLDNLAEIAVKCLNLENPYRRPCIKEVGRHIGLLQSRRL